MNEQGVLPLNLGLDLVRATEAAALSAGRWSGLGQPEEADRAATEALIRALSHVEMDAILRSGEADRIGEDAKLVADQRLGSGNGPEVDLLADALEGRRLLAGGYPGALSAVAAAPRGAIWMPGHARYMEKIVVNAEVAPALVPECLDAPAAWTLALVARAKGKKVRDLIVFVLDRPRHADLVAEIRSAGAHVLLRAGGDLAGALMACLRDGKVDVLMGAGGVPQGLLAACAVKAARGAMLGRLAVQNAPGEQSIRGSGDPDFRRIRSADEMVSGSCAFFIATGITDGPLLNGVRYEGTRAQSNSIILRAETGSRRIISAEHTIAE